MIRERISSMGTNTVAGEPAGRVSHGRRQRAGAGMLAAAAALLVLAGTALAGTVGGTPGVQPDAQDLVRRVCVGCHGPGGHASSPLFPHLAGQSAAYLAGELRAFRAHERSEPAARDYMWGIAGTLDDATIDALAEYYARQNPGAGGGYPVAEFTGAADLFQKGDPDRGIPACTTCHGDHGEGRDRFPRIAGQQDSYLRHQLRAMRVGERPAPVMKGVVERMNDAEIDAVAAFLAIQR